MENKNKGMGWILKTTIGAALLAFVINQGYDLYSRINCREVYITREDPELIERIEQSQNLTDITSIVEERRYCKHNMVKDYIDRLAQGREIDYLEMR